MNYIEPVREFMVENFLFGDSGRLADDTPFLKSGVIDSTGVLELISYLEETFGIKIEDDDVVPENLDTLRNVSNFVKSKLNGKDAG
jgi:acyl carrier protein